MQPCSRRSISPACAWRPLQRPARYAVKTQARARPDNVKEAVVVAREFENKRLQSEEVAEFNYQPTACSQVYRMVVVRKNISKEKGELMLDDDGNLALDWSDEILYRSCVAGRIEPVANSHQVAVNA